MGSTVTATGPASAAATGIVSALLTVSGHPYQDLVDNAANKKPDHRCGFIPQGVAALTVTANIIVVDEYRLRTTLFLATPDGNRYQIATRALTGNSIATLHQCARSRFPIPSYALDGNYTLEISDLSACRLRTITINSWSLKLFGKIVTPVLPSANVFENASFRSCPLPASRSREATATSSSLYLVGHTGQVIGSGILSVSLTDTNVQDLTITLVGPGRPDLRSAQVDRDCSTRPYALPASFLGTAINGQYQLQIVGLAGDVGQLTAWSLDLTPEGFVGPDVSSTNVPVAVDRDRHGQLDARSSTPSCLARRCRAGPSRSTCTNKQPGKSVT